MTPLGSHHGGFLGSPGQDPHLSCAISKQSIWANTSAISSFSFCGGGWGARSREGESEGGGQDRKGFTATTTPNTRPLSPLGVTPKPLCLEGSPHVLKIPGQTSASVCTLSSTTSDLAGGSPQVPTLCPTLLPAFPALPSAAVKSLALQPTSRQAVLHPAAIFLKHTWHLPCPCSNSFRGSLRPPPRPRQEARILAPRAGPRSASVSLRPSVCSATCP